MSPIRLAAVLIVISVLSVFKQAHHRGPTSLSCFRGAAVSCCVRPCRLGQAALLPVTVALLCAAVGVEASLAEAPQFPDLCNVKGSHTGTHKHTYAHAHSDSQTHRHRHTHTTHTLRHSYMYTHTDTCKETHRDTHRGEVIFTSQAGESGSRSSPLFTQGNMETQCKASKVQHRSVSQAPHEPRLCDIFSLSHGHTCSAIFQCLFFFFRTRSLSTI